MTKLTLCAAILLFVLPNLCFAEISVGTLSREQANEFGIAMHHRENGDAGVKVWLEFRKTGFLQKFSYCELHVNDGTGNRIVSARLQSVSVTDERSEEIVSVGFSATPEKLQKCAFMVVAYGSIRGDVGYLLNVRDFLDTENPPGLAVSVFGPKSARVGEKLRHEIVVTNNTGHDLNNVRLSCQFDSGLVHFSDPMRMRRISRSPIDSIGPGERVSEYVTFGVVKHGRLCHTVQVTADGHQVQTQTAIDAAQNAE